MSTDAPVPRWRRLGRWALHAGLLVLGGFAVGYLVHRAGGPSSVAAALRGFGVVVPVAFACEGARVAADAWRARLLYQSMGHSLAYARAFAVQLACYPIALFMPAGGAVGEAWKASVLAEEATAARATAVAVMNQALTPLACFVISVPVVAVAIDVWGFAGMTLAILGHTAIALGLGLAVLVAARRKLVARGAALLSEEAGEIARGSAQAIARTPWLPLGPLSAGVLARAAQLVMFLALAWAAGASPSARTALLTNGAHLVGSTAGDMVPAQIGATDGSFALAAEPLGVDAARALSIALVVHVVQIAWALLGLVGRLRVKARGAL